MIRRGHKKWHKFLISLIVFAVLFNSSSRGILAPQIARAARTFNWTTGNWTIDTDETTITHTALPNRTFTYVVDGGEADLYQNTILTGGEGTTSTRQSLVQTSVYPFKLVRSPTAGDTHTYYLLVHKNPGNNPRWIIFGFWEQSGIGSNCESESTTELFTKAKVPERGLGGNNVGRIVCFKKAAPPATSRPDTDYITEAISYFEARSANNPALSFNKPAVSSVSDEKIELSEIPDQCKSLILPTAILQDKDTDLLGHIRKAADPDGKLFRNVFFFDQREDNQLFQTFYSDGDLGYPNVHFTKGNAKTYTDNYYDAAAQAWIQLSEGRDFQEAFQSVSQSQAVKTTALASAATAGYTVGKTIFQKAVTSALQASRAVHPTTAAKLIGPVASKLWIPPQASASASLAGPIAIVGLVTIGSTIFVTHKINELNNQIAWGKIIQLMVANLYIDAHLQFHECMVKNGVTKAGFTQENLDAERKNFADVSKLTSGLLEDFNDKNPKSTCPPELNALPLGLGAALCGVADIVMGVAITVANFSFSLLLKATTLQ